jgi:hypothetical protein
MPFTLYIAMGEQKFPFISLFLVKEVQYTNKAGISGVW